MSVITARKNQQISAAPNTKQALIDAVGDLSGEDIFFNNILVATYIRPNKTMGGILIPEKSQDEDQWQGKVGLVLKKGPDAFVSDANVDFNGQNVQPGDWVVYRVGDGWPVSIRGTSCRVLTDRSIRMKIKHPEDIF